MKLKNNLSKLTNSGTHKLSSLAETVTKELTDGEASVLDDTINALTNDATILTEIMNVAVRSKLRLMLAGMAANYGLVFRKPSVSKLYIYPVHSDVDYWVEARFLDNKITFQTVFDNSSQARVPEFIRDLSLPPIDIRHSDEVILNSLRKRFNKIKQWFITAEQQLQEENK